MPDAIVRARQSSPHPGLSFTAFVGMMASFMALNGLAIDSMLPALPQIGTEFGIDDENARQWVITAYLLGFGGGQIVYGPVSDRFGRRPALLFGAALYTVSSIATAFATSFDIMLMTRFVQGLGAAASRVIVIAIVRDCYSGRQMARVMSLALIVFLSVPILAPSIGQAVMLVVSWHWIFVLLAGISLALFLWSFVGLPETLDAAHRIPLSFRQTALSFREALSNRISVGYTMATTLMLGSLFGFVNSAQQVFADVFDIPTLFTLIFAVNAASMAVASFFNSRIVERLGTRLVSHSALLAFLVVSTVALVAALTGHENLLSFTILQSLLLFCFGLTAPNFGAMAMEPVGHIAGAASSMQGFITTLGGALLGFAIGQQFDGTTVPLHAGFLVTSAAAIGFILWTEGRLFQARHQAAV